VVATQYQVETVLVQTARGLPASDSGWTTQRYLRSQGGSEGSNQSLGEHTLVQDFGIVKAQATTSFASVGIAPDIARTALVDDLVGLVVRLLKSDDDGLISIGGETYTAYWHGVIQRQTIQPDLADSVDTGGRVTWLAIGIAHVLDTIHLDRGWMKTASGVVDPGYLPPFNRQPGGDRSTSTATVNGQSVYVHQVGDPNVSNEWTALTILDLLIAGAATPTLAGGTAVYGWTWALSVQDSCLDYIPEDLDLGGLTLLQAIDELASTRRAIAWTVAVSGSTVTITVRSAATEAISVGGVDIAASTKTATLIAAGDHQIEGLTIEQDEQSTYDVVKVRGGHPVTGMTVVYPDSLDQGWNPALETDWNRFPESPLYEQVWRRFLLPDDWDETGEGLDGLHNTASVGTSADYGVNGLTGERSLTAAADLVPGYQHHGERMLPCGDLFSSSGIGPRQAPVVVVYDGTATYEDMSLKWRVEVQQEPFAIVIDDGFHGTQLRDRMAVSGARLYVSVGIREHRPLAISWQRDPSEFPRATPRVKLIDAPSCELWQVRSLTVTGVDGDVVRGAVGADVTFVAVEITARDDRPRMDAILALARAWFTVPAYRVRWTRRGVLDTDSEFAPGTLLTSVQLGDRTYGTYALITRRTWSLVKRGDVEMWDTTYETQRVLPDLGTIL
jgi:hypothetical protein